MVTTEVACPPEQQIAAFIEGTLPSNERTRLLRHVDSCANCFDLIAILSADDGETRPQVDPALIRAVVRRPEPSWFRRQLPAVAAAAVVLLAVGWWRLPGRTTTQPTPTDLAAPVAPDQSTRSVAAAEIVVEQPKDGDILLGRPQVRWTGPADAVSYEVFVTTPAGDVLWQKRVGGAARTLSLDAPLPAGQSCYVWVDAYLPEGRQLTSNVVKVRAGD
jgi:hypothetical protein